MSSKVSNLRNIIIDFKLFNVIECTNLVNIKVNFITLIISMVVFISTNDSTEGKETVTYKLD